MLIIISFWRAVHSLAQEKRMHGRTSMFTFKLYLYQRLWVSCRAFLGCFMWQRVARLTARGICFGPAGHCSSVVGLVLCESAPRSLGSFIKRGGGAGGGGGARRPVESWRCSRDEVMLVDCWEPAMGIKVMKGHMQKRGESYFGSFIFFLGVSFDVSQRVCSSAALGGGGDKQRRLFAFPHLCFDTCRAPSLTFGWARAIGILRSFTQTFKFD